MPDPSLPARAHADDVEWAGVIGFAGHQHRLAAGRQDPAQERVGGDAAEGIRAAPDREVVGVGRGEVEMVVARAGVDLTGRSGFSTGVSRRSLAFTTFNRIVLRPTLGASEAIVTAEKPGWRASNRDAVPQVLDHLPQAAGRHAGRLTHRTPE